MAENKTVIRVADDIFGTVEVTTGSLTTVFVSNLDAAERIGELQREIERLRAESHVMKTALTEIRDTGTGECAATIALKALFEAAKAAKEK
jgi:uncharacterized small protein (DUF1192 family)